MNIKYRIIEVHQKEHSFVVRYYTDLITEDMLACQFNEDGSIMRNVYDAPIRCRTDYNLTMFNDHASEEDIDQQIRQAAPAEWLRIQEANMQRTTDNMTPALGRALAKINIDHEFEHIPQITQKSELSDVEVEALLSKFVKANAK